MRLRGDLPPDAPEQAAALLDWARIGLALYIAASSTFAQFYPDLAAKREIDE